MEIDKMTPSQPDRIERAPVNKKVVRKIIQNRWLKNQLDFSDENIGFHGGPQKKPGLRLALWTWLSVTIDGLLLLALTSFSVVIFSILMKTSARHLILEVFSQPRIGVVFGFLFALIFWCYLIFMRVFNGATFGEQSCSLRLGQPMQRMQSNYILKVALRTTLIMITGVLPLPILSLFFKRDLAGDVSGVKIYSLNF